MRQIENKLEKNNNIKASMKETLNRRKSQFCRIYELKIQNNKLSAKQKEQLKMLFVEAKWLYNDILNWSELNVENTVFNYTIKNVVDVKLKDGTFIQKELNTIGSQMKQSVHKQICSSIKTLSTLKKTGHKVGKLKFKSDYNSINLKQFGTTYRFYNNHKAKIQGIHGKIHLNGLDQIKNNVEFANAKIVKRQNGYYLLVTTYTDNKFKKSYKNQKSDVGIDMGCLTSLTLSTGEKIDVKIEESEHLKHYQRKMFKQKKGSNNRHKTINKIQKEHQKINNKKKDITNKLVNYLNSNFRYIFIQDEQLTKWHKTGHGKAIQHSILGRIKNKLKSQNNCYVISKWLPTSKYCYDCGIKHTLLSINDREFVCPSCGVVYDRDVHAATNILKYGLDLVPPEQRKFMLSDSESYTGIFDTSKVWDMTKEATNL
ncbi:MAG: transposase [Bacteroidales bacterium]|nr:transposase [Bacteroidales bacterium]